MIPSVLLHVVFSFNMDVNEIKKFDPQKMYQVYDEWPTLAREAYEKEFSKIQFEDVDHVVLAGKCVRDDVCGQIKNYITELEGKAGLEYERLSQEL